MEKEITHEQLVIEDLATMNGQLQKQLSILKVNYSYLLQEYNKLKEEKEKEE